MRYCIGDIHGCIKTLERLISQIYKQDSNPKFFFVGDLIDRGPDSKSVIDLIIELTKKDLAQVVLGNHEVMMLSTYKYNRIVTESMWQQNGAVSTLFSFNPKANIKLPVKDLIPKEYYQFINALPYFIELKDYFIVHAGFNFNDNNPFTETDSMVWTREEKNNYKYTKGKTIIHGHTPIPVEQIKTQMGNTKTDIINIDSGCVYTQRKSLGILTALNMDEKTILYVKNIDSE
ncbi:MAG: serine/threonine protein phosphatase [Bacteroidetes bacterium]|nr:serine/threonine protein phosphatase [Bacteroidota bacterium]